MTARQDSGNAITDSDVLNAARAMGVLSSNAQSAPMILATLCREGIGAREVAEVLGREPGLTARVLRIANSAFYGVTRSIATIDRAVVVLGLDAVRGIAAAACLNRGFLSPGDSLPIDVSDMLRHSVATAAAAQTLAGRGDKTLAPEAFIGGLLHDLGITLQLKLDSAGLAAAAAAAQSRSPTGTRELENRHARISHERCATVLFHAWKLPDGLVAVAGHHHAPGHAPRAHRRLVELVSLGECLSIHAGMGFGAEISCPDPDAALLSSLQISTAELLEIEDGLPRMVADLQGALAD